MTLRPFVNWPPCFLKSTVFSKRKIHSACACTLHACSIDFCIAPWYRSRVILIQRHFTKKCGSCMTTQAILSATGLGGSDFLTLLAHLAPSERLLIHRVLQFYSACNHWSTSIFSTTTTSSSDESSCTVTYLLISSLVMIF